MAHSLTITSIAFFLCKVVYSLVMTVFSYSGMSASQQSKPWDIGKRVLCLLIPDLFPVGSSNYLMPED